MAQNKEIPTWERSVMERREHENFKSTTCHVHNYQSRYLLNADKFCRCGRLVRCHSFNGKCLSLSPNNVSNDMPKPRQTFNPSSHATGVPVTVFGTLKPNGCKFIRMDDQTNMQVIYELLVDNGEKEKAKPSLVLSVYGGAKYFTATEKLEKEIVRGIIDAAAKADAWILTTGINNGVSKLIGEGVAHFRLLKEDLTKMKCIGLTMWGTVNESTRLELKRATHQYPEDLISQQIPDSVKETDETIEKNHTHCILFDNGRLVDHLGDPQRSHLVAQACQIENHICDAVTIIIEGGENTLDVILNDINDERPRPIILIQGSGRLADTLISLIEMTPISNENQHFVPKPEDIKKALYKFFPNPNKLYLKSTTEKIERVLEPDTRYLLNIFSLDQNDSIVETIFKAINTMKNTQKKNNEEEHRRIDDGLLDLGLKWNCIKEILPILQSRQNDIIKGRPESKQRAIECFQGLFKKALIKNRPVFVEYLLSSGFDPCTLIEIQNLSQRRTSLLNLYKDRYEQMNKSHVESLETILDKPTIKTIQELDRLLNKFVGPYIGNIYSHKDDLIQRATIDMSNHICICCKPENNSCFQFQKQDMLYDYNNQSSHSKDELLRDLFVWAVFMDMPDMARTLLVYLQSRICAALIASAIFKRYAKESISIYLKEKFKNQSDQFETYAATFIAECHEYNESLACELLLREIPLFGDVTCMQVAISSESKKFVGTYCFSQTLREVWYYRLSVRNHQAFTKPLQVCSTLSLGLLAPLILPYRKKEIKSNDELLSRKGITYYITKEETNRSKICIYWLRLKHYHQSPMIKMFYHFLSYIGFLLVFSYMMLYRLDNPRTTRPHWTEIYVIVTVSTMLCEEVRKLFHDYKKRMIERWNSMESAVLMTFKIIFLTTPYILFYLGLGLRYGATSHDILTAAKIIWAFDLEMWYLGSLKFIIALKSIGPKLAMLKNMFRDLFGFLYMIFIAIAAYGVISRALIFYKEVPFTVPGIFEKIFYEPYWFMFGEFKDKETLDEKISNDTESIVAEATATHVLLAFHMLFINILILNLLIAVFAFTITKVHENTEFYWRYQRYSLVREYFERPPLAYPPLIIFSHMFLAFLYIKDKCCPKFCNNRITDQNYVPLRKRLTRVFKMIPVNKIQKNDRWNQFENAATYSYARSLIEQDKKKSNITTNDTHLTNMLNTTKSEEEKQKEIPEIKSTIDDSQKTIEKLNTKIDTHIQQMNTSLQWIMRAMERVKMHDRNDPPPNFKSE